MPDVAEVYQMFLGEYGWAPASRHFHKPYSGDQGWTRPDHGCPVKIRPVAFEYHKEGNGFDCSIDEGYTLQLPIEDLRTVLGLRWTGRGADFVDPAGRLVTRDPTATAPGPSAFLLRAEVLQELHDRHRLTLCWALLGEKRVLGAGFDEPPSPALRITGAYALLDSKLKGFAKAMLADPAEPAPLPTVLSIRRTS